MAIKNIFLITLIGIGCSAHGFQQEAPPALVKAIEESNLTSFLAQWQDNTLSAAAHVALVALSQNVLEKRKAEFAFNKPEYPAALKLLLGTFLCWGGHWIRVKLFESALASSMLNRMSDVMSDVKRGNPHEWLEDFKANRLFNRQENGQRLAGAVINCVCLGLAAIAFWKGISGFIGSRKKANTAYENAIKISYLLQQQR